MKIIGLLVLPLLIRPASADHASLIQVASPDQQVRIGMALASRNNGPAMPVYHFHYKDKPVIEKAALGLTLQNASPWSHGFAIHHQSRRHVDRSYAPVWGEKKIHRNHYNELSVTLRETGGPGRTLIITFRAYNEGAAFRYTVPRQKGLERVEIASENTQFRFLADHTAHAVYSAQGIYRKVPLSQVKRNCERPLTLETKAGPVFAVGEAALVNYARMRLSRHPTEPLTLVSSLAGPVSLDTPLSTPWRVILSGDSPGDLIEKNQLFVNLNAPCAIKDTSWIKPGKVIREVTLTTQGGKACVDFAAAHNLQYVEFDAGWYGPEGSGASDATTVTLDRNRSRGPLDLPGIIRYAEEKGIGIWLYVNRRALERQLDDLLPLYQKWGIKGIKYGFVQVGDQQWTAWVHEAVRKTAAHKIMVDIHDEYRPTGYSRTYPNLMTQEGIRGNECMPTASENLILPFTRQLCGPGDYTVCYYNNRIKTTHGHQLAAAVVFFSPLQFLFWYDRPSAYRGEPEIEFFEKVPTVWDDTKVIHGRIGEYITMARRSGHDWFVGSMTNTDGRSLTIPLSFLDKSRDYRAHIYSDGGGAIKSRTQIKVETRRVNAETVLEADMPPSGGQAVWLEAL